jgi:transposase
MLAFLYGTISEKITKNLRKLPAWFIKNVSEVAIDMSPTMEKIVREAFTYATIVIDRFHVRFNINEQIKLVKNRIKRAIKKQETKKKKR